MAAESDLSVQVEFPGRDLIRASRKGSAWSLEFIGCVELEDQLKKNFAENPQIDQWQVPQGTSHSEMLIRELILRARQQWSYPYQHEELCHCRSVPTDVVDQAILAGALTCAQVSARTSASTACGTCRPDVQKIIDYRLGRSGVGS